MTLALHTLRLAPLLLLGIACFPQYEDECDPTWETCGADYRCHSCEYFGYYETEGYCNSGTTVYRDTCEQLYGTPTGDYSSSCDDYSDTTSYYGDQQWDAICQAAGYYRECVGSSEANTTCEQLGSRANDCPHC